MSTYVFKAMDLAGVRAHGEVEAESKQAVSDQLKARGLIVLDIADKHASREIEFGFAKRVKASELAIFSRHGIDPATVVVIGALFGPSQVTARICEFAFARNVVARVEEIKASSSESVIQIQ